MSVAEFVKDPPRESHEIYRSSLFDITAAEYSEGEDLVGSAYRGLVLGVSDSDVNGQLIRGIPTRIPAADGGSELWDTLLLGTDGLASPARSGKRSRVPELMPMVPRIAHYAGVRGEFGRSRWFPANLLLEVIGTGTGLADGQILLEALRRALDVDVTDDVISRFLNRVIPEPNRASPPHLLQLTADHTKAYCAPTSAGMDCVPARQFCADLRAIIELKNKLTRRQWTVLLEAVLRLGMAFHTLWICRANATFWTLLQAVGEGNAVPNDSNIREIVWGSAENPQPVLEIGRDARSLLRQWLEGYVYARFGINLVLHRLEDAGQPWLTAQVLGHVPGSSITAPQALNTFLQHVATHRTLIDPTNAAEWMRRQCMGICDHRLDLLTCENGFTRNMFFFLRHGLGQIETQDEDQKSYDQSFLIGKRGSGRRRQWPVEPGPAMLIALVHACCHAQRGLPTTLEDFRLHLARYGLHAPAGELLSGTIGTSLERLGLVVDSPDAAGGRLLVAPF